MTKPVGEPDAGNPHVRFDERGWETERCRMAQATAPILDSTERDPRFIAADICSLRSSGQQCCGAVMRAIDPNQTNAVSGFCNAIIAPWGLQASDRRGSLRWLEIYT